MNKEDFTNILIAEYTTTAELYVRHGTNSALRSPIRTDVPIYVTDANYLINKDSLFYVTRGGRIYIYTTTDWRKVA